MKLYKIISILFVIVAVLCSCSIIRYSLSHTIPTFDGGDIVSIELIIEDGNDN